MPSPPRAQRRWSPLVWGALWFASACEAEVVVSTVALELRAPPGCDLTSPSRFELQVLGDFRAQRETFEWRGASANFEPFPIETRELAIEGRFEGDVVARGRASVPSGGTSEGEPLPVVLLPERASCPLGDPFLRPGEGSAVAPLPGGGFLMAGGTDADGRVRSSAIVVRAGRTLLEQVPDGMLLRRRDASATLAGEFIVVAGGVRESRGGAEDNYEVYDLRLGRFARERSEQLSEGARTEHGAALLPDGSVLLVGGRSEPGGSPLASAQLIRLDAPAPEQPAGLSTARVAPQVLVLDSGAVLVAGGRDQQGVVVTSVERFEAAARRFVTLLGLPAFENAVAVALPGARLGWVGCDTRGRAACGLTLVLLRGDEPIAIDVPLEWADHAPRGLTELRALALEDGRLLVTGRDPDGAMQSRAILVELGERELETIPATRAPAILVRLEDGAIAELDRPGVSLRRVGSVSVYDSPAGDLLSEARLLRVLVDAPDRWHRSADGWRALVAGARLDVPRLRLGNFRAELGVRGGAVVRLRVSDAPGLAVRVGASDPAAESCERVSLSGRVVLERRGGVLRVSSESSERACVVAWPERGLAGFAIEAEADTVVQRLVITRL